MAKARNKVIAGWREGQTIMGLLGSLSIDGVVQINRTTVENYELVADEQRKSASSGVARGLVGGALLGPVGMIAGGVSAKNKGIYTVAVYFRNGQRSLIEMDDKCYKLLIKNCF